MSLSVDHFRNDHSSLQIPLQTEEYELFRIYNSSRLLEELARTVDEIEERSQQCDGRSRCFCATSVWYRTARKHLTFVVSQALCHII